MAITKLTDKKHKNIKFAIVTWATITWVILALPHVSWATQIHDRPEGLFAHQMAHIFFMTSMIFLVYWLRKNRFVEQKGWRLIQYSGILFALWNIDAMLVHWIDDHLDISVFIGSQADWSRKLIIKDHLELIVYYVGKMDHLLCVPAIFLLYLGIKRLHEDGHPMAVNNEDLGLSELKNKEAHF